MATAEVHVKVAGLPAVREALDEAAEEIRALRSLLRAWEPRVRCPQCGQRYAGQSCGPSHAIVRVQVWGRA